MKKIILSIVVFTLLASCGRANTVSTPDVHLPDIEDDRMHISVISKGYQHQFWQAVRAGSYQAAVDLGVNVSFAGSEGENAIADQVDIIDSELAKNPAAIAIAAHDTESILSQLQEAYDRGIPIIGFESGIPDAPAEHIAAHTSTNNEMAAALGAERMHRQLKNRISRATSDNPVEISILTQDVTCAVIQSRIRGFALKMAELAREHNRAGISVRGDFDDINRGSTRAAVRINIVAGATPDIADMTNAAKSVLDTPNLIGVFCSSEMAANGLLAAVEAGYVIPDGVKVVGFDVGTKQKSAVRTNVFIGSLAQDSFQIGYNAVVIAVAAAKGESVSDLDICAKWYFTVNMNNPDIALLLYECEDEASTRYKDVAQEEPGENLDLAVYAFPDVATRRGNSGLTIHDYPRNNEFPNHGSVGGTFKVINNSTRDLNVIAMSRIERKQNRFGVWYEIEEAGRQRKALNTPAGGHTAFLRDSVIWLKPGEYRLVITFYCRENFENNLEVFVEFDVLTEPPVSDGIDVTMEVIPERVSPWGASFLISNNSGFDLVYTSRWDNQYQQLFHLEDGEQKIVTQMWPSREPGEHSMSKTFFQHGNYAVRKYVQTEFTIPLYEERDVEIALELVSIDSDEMIMAITNNTSNHVMFDGSYSVTRDLDGYWIDAGSRTATNRYHLLPGERKEIRWGYPRWRGFGPGYLRISMGVMIGTENLETAWATGVYTDEFLVENDSIPEDIVGIHMEAGRGSSGTWFCLTNAFQEDWIYFDREYRLQQEIDGVWHDVPYINSPIFPNYIHSLPPRQIRNWIGVMNWIGIYGILPPGEYRIKKTFWYYTEADETITNEVYAPFTIRGNPIVRTYRAEVIMNYSCHSRRADYLLVRYCISNVIESCFADLYPHGGYITDSVVKFCDTYIDDENPLGQTIILNKIALRHNERIAALNAHGEPILISDIPEGALVEISSGVESSGLGYVEVGGYWARDSPNGKLVRIVE